MTDYAIADNVAWVSRADLDYGSAPVAYVARLPHGPTIVLEGSACLVWQLVDEGGTLDLIAERAADLSEMDPADLVDDVAGLLNDLVARGFVASR